MDTPELLTNSVEHAIDEARRLRRLVGRCDATARRALTIAKDEPDGARADRYLRAAICLVAARNVLMREAEEALLAGGRALREAGG